MKDNMYRANVPGERRGRKVGVREIACVSEGELKFTNLCAFPAVLNALLLRRIRGF